MTMMNINDLEAEKRALVLPDSFEKWHHLFNYAMKLPGVKADYERYGDNVIVKFRYIDTEALRGQVTMPINEIPPVNEVKQLRFEAPIWLIKLKMVDELIENSFTYEEVKKVKDLLRQDSRTQDDYNKNMMIVEKMHQQSK